MKTHKLIPSMSMVPLIVLILFFQNCGAVFQPSTLQFDPKEILLTSLAAEADFSWTLDAAKSLIALTPFGHTEKWIDRTDNHITLVPPFMPYADLLNVSASSRWMDTKKGPRLHFSKNSSLSSIAQDDTKFASDEYSVLIFIDQTQLPLTETPTVVTPTEAPASSTATTDNPTTEPLPEGQAATTPALKVLRLLTLETADVAQNGQLTLEILETNKALSLVAQQWFSADSFASTTLPLDPTQLEHGLAIGVRFSNKADNLSIVVNGEFQSNPPILTNDLPKFGFVPRTLTLHSPKDEDGGRFNLADFGLYKRALGDLELKTFTLGLYRNYELNEPTSLASLDGLISSNTSSIFFADILPYFEKTIGAGSCTGCHSELYARTEALALTSNGQAWIVPGKPENSLIIQALRHSGSAHPMPKGGGQMNEEDILQIEKWIAEGAL
jgi:hypothetical protein